MSTPWRDRERKCPACNGRCTVVKTYDEYGMADPKDVPCVTCDGIGRVASIASLDALKAENARLLGVAALQNEVADRALKAQVAAEAREAKLRDLLTRCKPRHYPGECEHCGIDELPPEDCPFLKFIAEVDAVLTPQRETCVCGHLKGRHQTTNLGNVTHCADCGCQAFTPQREADEHRWRHIGPADRPVGFHCDHCDMDLKVEWPTSQREAQ